MAYSEWGFRVTGKKVMVIDDEPAIHRLINIILEDEGFLIVGPQEHREAKHSIVGGKPDVIILDIMMPEVDGFDILRMLKEDDETMHIPVIILSVRSLQEDIDKAMSLGADHYLTKPFEPSELISTLKTVLAGSAGG
jgi:DNA-binding response OmpR family regulator